MTADPKPWAERAACLGVDPEVFFPEQGHTPPRWARALCEVCPVAAECLAYALRHRVLGWWAGTSEKTRRRWHSEDRRRAS